MPTPHKLKSGADAHILTDEDRRKGALVAAQRRRELGMSLREKVAKELDEHATALVAAAVEKGEGGDWQAFLALWKQTHGAPPVEITGEDGAPLEVHVDHDYGNLVDKLEQAGVIQRGPTATPDA